VEMTRSGPSLATAPAWCHIEVAARLIVVGGADEYIHTGLQGPEA
jgi:hypothetical protein